MKIISIVLTSIALVSCLDQEKSQVDTSQSPIVQQIKVGTSYNSLSGEYGLGKPCLLNSPANQKFLFSSEGNLEGGYAESFQSIEDSLRVTGSAKLNVGLGKFKGSLSVANSLANSEMKTSYFTSYTFNLGTMALITPTLSQSGQAAKSKNPFLRLAECGDEFVTQVDYGVRLHIGLEFSFHSKEMKQFFDYAVKVEESVTGKDIINFHDGQQAALADLVADVKVIFIQEGGDQDRVLEIRKGLSKDCYVGGEKAHHIRKKGFGAKNQVLGEDYERCLEDYKKLTDYAFNELPKQLAQDENEPLEQRMERFKALKYHTRPYINIGYPSFSELAIEIPQDVKMFFKQLKDLRDLYLKLSQGNLSYKNILTNTKDTFISRLEESFSKDAKSTSCNIYDEYQGSIFDKISLLVGKNESVLAQVEDGINNCQARIYSAIIEDTKSPQGRVQQVLKSCQDQLFGNSPSKNAVIYKIKERLTSMCLN